MSPIIGQDECRRADTFEPCAVFPAANIAYSAQTGEESPWTNLMRDSLTGDEAACLASRKFNDAKFVTGHGVDKWCPQQSAPDRST